MKKPVLALLPMILLMACVEGTAPIPGPMPVAEESCGAEELQGLVGQPSTVLQTMKFGTTVRVIEADMAVTMDYLPNRLNIWLSPEKVIARVTCG